ncbi:MAG: universal stress protein [Rubrobacteraceae bacterium]
MVPIENDTREPFGTVLLATDGSEESKYATELAVSICRASGANLYVVNVSILPGVIGDPEVMVADSEVVQGLRANVRAEARKRLEADLARISDLGGTVSEYYERFGLSDREIVRLAEELDADLVVIESHSFGALNRAPIGGSAHSVVHYAHCPVLVARVPDPAPSQEAQGDSTPIFGKILAAVDGSREAEAAALKAAQLARVTGSELHLVHVGIEYYLFVHDYVSPAQFERLKQERQAVLDEQLRKLEASGIGVEDAHVRMGHRVDEEVIKLAGELGARLIVTGSRGRTALSRVVMGSDSDSIVRHAHCPVLVIRPEDPHRG